MVKFWQAKQIQPVDLPAALDRALAEQGIKPIDPAELDARRYEGTNALEQYLQHIQQRDIQNAAIRQAQEELLNRQIEQLAQRLHRQHQENLRNQYASSTFQYIPRGFYGYNP